MICLASITHEKIREADFLMFSGGIEENEVA